MKPYDLHFLPDAGADLDEPLEITWLDEKLNEGVTTDALKLTARGPGKAKLRLSKVSPESAGDPVVRVQGTIAVPLGCTCVRCLGDVPFDVETPLDMTFFPEGGGPETQGDEDLDVGFYKQMILDLPEIVREAILLELAMNPTCEDEDACQVRTATLLASVNPADDGIDPRWAGLLKIQLKSS